MYNPEVDFPKFNAPEVAEAAKQLISMSRAQDRLNSFHRQYFVNNLTRVAMNVVLLRLLIQPEDWYLDVGSFGIEPALVRVQFPSCTIKALSYEGNVIGINANGFLETKNLQEDSDCVIIDQVDVENQCFPYPESCFDIVTCFEVLEHLKHNPVRMMKEIKRVLKPTGVLILTTPNINSSSCFLRMLRGYSPQECPFFSSNPEYGVIHPKEYTVGEVWALLTGLGFEIQKLYTLDMKIVGRAERLASYYIKAMVSIFKRNNLLAEDFNELSLGEKIAVFAQRGGAITTETPVQLFS